MSCRFLTKAADAKTNTIAARDSLIELKFMPTGESPRNNPERPTMPKLNATESTIPSTVSTLFSFVANNMFTRQ